MQTPALTLPKKGLSLTGHLGSDKIKTMSRLSGSFLILIIIVLILGAGAATYFLLTKPKSTTNPQTSIYQPSGTDNKKVATRDPKLHADKTDQFRIEYGRIRNLLPYESGDVRVEYHEDLGFITARIKDVKTEDEFLAKKLTAENFLKSKGVEDLCGLALTWIPPQDLKIAVKNSLSAGCTF